MKKILLILVLLTMPVAFACDMGGGSEITGAHISDTNGMMGFGMIGFNYVWILFFLYFVIGLGYIIYKLIQIENKIGRKK